VRGRSRATAVLCGVRRWAGAQRLSTTRLPCAPQRHAPRPVTTDGTPAAPCQQPARARAGLRRRLGPAIEPWHCAAMRDPGAPAVCLPLGCAGQRPGLACRRAGDAAGAGRAGGRRGAAAAPRRRRGRVRQLRAHGTAAAGAAACVPGRQGAGAAAGPGRRRGTPVGAGLMRAACSFAAPSMLSCAHAVQRHHEYCPAVREY